ncbi:hypothetical protein CsatB_011261 [Cannabis sativa]
MDRDVLRQQLSEFMTSMELEGYVDFHFNISYSVKRMDGPFSFIELLNNFRSDSQATLRAMTQALEQQDLNFDDLEQHCLKLKGSTACIGIHRMALACGDMMNAIARGSKEECILILHHMKQLFQVLQDKFDIICQLERRINEPMPNA